MPPLSIVLALIAVNLMTYAAFYFDKRSAVAGKRRIAEKDLLMLALLGGTPGAFLARRRFRHKTRKEPFSTRLQVIACLQAGCLIGWFVF